MRTRDGLAVEPAAETGQALLPDRAAMSTVGMDLTGSDDFGSDDFAVAMNEALALYFESTNSVAFAGAEQTLIMTQTDPAVAAEMEG